MRPLADQIDLKQFQAATVKEIIRRTSRKAGGSRLALADEVGLGKTHIMGKVARRLGKRGAIVMYVAPSLEVAHQNRIRLQKALGIRDSEGKRALETRLTLLPADLKPASTRLVCLTPNTSFQLKGTGSRRERAFLYTVFRRLRPKLGLPKAAFVAGRRFRWERVFYRPRGRADREYRREWQLDPWRSAARESEEQARKIARSILGAAPHVEQLRKVLGELRVEHASSDTAAFKQSGRLVSALREVVAWQVLTGPFKPRLAFFDEWHRYQRLMTELDKAGHNLLARALLHWREGSRKAPKLTLLVSATPFEVTFGPERQGRSGDLERLCRLLDPGGRFSHHVDEARSAFQQSWDCFADALVKGNKRLVRSARRQCRNAAERFSDVLFRHVLRTERPSPPIRAGIHAQSDGARGDWIDADLASLAKARQLSRKHESGSDIIGLWHSSTHFFRMADTYQLAAKLKGRRAASVPARTQHWKRARLKALLHARWSSAPPLWISPSTAQAGGGKLLVFSGWRSVPRELTYFFSDEARCWRTRPSSTATPLGAFPLVDRKGEKESFSLEKQGWRIFYPPLCASQDDAEAFLSWIASQLPTKGQPRTRTSIDWAQALYGLDLAYAEYVGQDKRRARLARRAAEQRRKLLGKKPARSWQTLLGGDRSGFRALRRALTSKGKLPDLPGWALARALRSGANADALLDPGIQHPLLRLARSINNYFNRPVCQGIIRAQQRRRSTIYPDAIIRYCTRHNWQDTWQEYASLLKPEGDLATVLQMMADSLETKATRRAGAGWAGERAGRTATIVQPFIEAKISGPKSADAQEQGALVTTQRRLSFNSPFFPHVLVSTSVGQEGVDFHRYCDTVVHWNPPPSPLALEQREGRVDRYRSLQVRVALKKPGASKKEHAGGFSPDFCVIGKDGHRINKTNSIVLRLPFSREDQVWNRCLERLHYSRLFLGSPDPEALEAQLRDRLAPLPRIQRDRALRGLASVSVGISPYSRH